MTISNNKKEVTGVKLLMSGANKYFATATGTSPMSIGGTKYTLADLTQRMQTFVDLSDGVDTAKATYQEKLNEAATQKPALRTVIRAFTAYVRVTFGESPGTLVDFGLAPRKAPQPRTVEAKTASVEKGLATRKARNTMGPKQKKQVKGTVEVPAPRPAAADSQPVAPSAPVPSAPVTNASAPTSPAVSSPGASSVTPSQGASPVTAPRAT